jgi:hypothetical protein
MIKEWVVKESESMGEMTSDTTVGGRVEGVGFAGGRSGDGGEVGVGLLPSRRYCDDRYATGSSFHEKQHPWEAYDSPV